MGAAAALALQEGAAERERFRTLRDRLENGILSGVDGVAVNGHRERRLATTSNLSFTGVDGEHLMKAMPDVAVSSASACTSAALQPSYVLGGDRRRDWQGRRRRQGAAEWSAPLRRMS